MRKWGKAVEAFERQWVYGTQAPKPVFNIKCARQSLINTSLFCSQPAEESGGHSLQKG